MLWLDSTSLDGLVSVGGSVGRHIPLPSSSPSRNLPSFLLQPFIKIQAWMDSLAIAGPTLVA
jgi:hypothetical protein